MLQIIYRILLPTLLVLFAIASSYSQSDSKFTKLLEQLDKMEERPRIGLALSGGAAHGLAHIGVIKYLEELGIKVDYITGTSMGSIVGGLYALGYDANRLELIASSQNWRKLLLSTEALNEVAFSEKFYHNKFPLELNYESKSLSLPKGFLAGQKLDMLISKWYSPALGIRDFNDLPIPFKCFAVDIESGEIVSLQEGNLARAIRASMAIPSVFPPVELDGRLLVDGGLIRNFPVTDNFEMGADIVIGVYAGFQLEEKEKLKSLVEILRQSSHLLSVKDSDAQKEAASILIEPQTKDIDSFSFGDYEELIRRGYD